MAKKAKKKAKKTSKKKGAKKAAKKTKKKARRTTMYSSKGKKLYAVRSADGQFKDIQQYSRAHAMDMQRHAAAEG
jgi:DNA-binding protein HU-beta